MKSFEEFVNESINFRLGGSSDKGKVTKTFEELEEGDKIYFYRFKNHKFEHSYVMDVKSKEIDFDKTLIRGRWDDGERGFVNISNDDLDKDFQISFFESAEYFSGLLWTTYELDIESAIKIYNDQRSLKESVDFRLGGSSDKGKVTKSFEELEEGDKVYFFRFKSHKLEFCDILDVKSKEIEKLCCLIRGEWDYAGSNGFVRINNDSLDKDFQISFFESEYIYSGLWTTYKLDKESAIKMYNDNRPLEESVDFRLGGSKDKVRQLPSIDDLKVGDKAFVYEINRDFKVYEFKSSVEECTKRRITLYDEGNNYQFNFWLEQEIRDYDSMLVHVYPDDKSILILSIEQADERDLIAIAKDLIQQ